MPLAGNCGCSSAVVAPCAGCSNCGSTPMFAQVAYQQPIQTTTTPIVTSAPTTTIPVQQVATPITTPGCAGCGTTYTQPIAQPVTTGCNGCGTTTYASPVAYSPAPTPATTTYTAPQTTYTTPVQTAPVQSYTAPATTTYATPVSTGCSTCQQQQQYVAPANTCCEQQRRGILRGGILNRR